MRLSQRFLSHAYLDEIAQGNLVRLLTAVARGEVTRADKLAQLHPHLLLQEAPVVDYSRCTFNTTALRVASYHLNTRMCEALLCYLPQQHAIDQLTKGDVAHKSPHFPFYVERKHIDFNPLLKALEDFICSYHNSTEDQRNKSWAIIEKERRMLPPQLAMLHFSKKIISSGSHYSLFGARYADFTAGLEPNYKQLSQFYDPKKSLPAVSVGVCSLDAARKDLETFKKVSQAVNLEYGIFLGKLLSSCDTTSIKRAEL